MDTSNEFFRDLKYRTIHVKVSFNKLDDRVLPPIVGKLVNPLQQLHLYLNTEDCVQDDVAEPKTSWESSGKWRSKNLITHKDIKWFLSIPAQSLDWYCAGPLLDDHYTLMRALRKYEDISLNIHPYINTYVSLNQLDNSKRIKFLSITNCYSDRLPNLPSLVEFTLKNDSGDEVNLRSLINSLSLKKVTFDWCRSTILIPKQLKERGVIINRLDDYSLKLVEVDVEQNNNHDSTESENEENVNRDHDTDDGNEANDNLNDGSSNIYDENEVTVYEDEDSENEDDDEGDAQYYSD